MMTRPNRRNAKYWHGERFRNFIYEEDLEAYIDHILKKLKGIGNQFDIDPKIIRFYLKQMEISSDKAKKK